MTAKVSIVIPALNEASCIERTLRHLQLLHPPAWEIIVVDGGSQDETVDITQAAIAQAAIAQAAIAQATNTQPTNTQTANIQAAKITVISAAAGRSVQMNEGAMIATLDILCFLHADTLVPDDLVALIENTLADATIACGGFISLMAGADTTRWSISFHNYLKTYYAPLLFRPHLFFGKGLRLLFGDQVMFCRRNEFWQCGGFDATLPIMEEADLCLKLVQLGRIRLVNRVVQSSDRRVTKWGVLKANVVYLMIGILWGVGVSATTLKRFYEEIR